MYTSESLVCVTKNITNQFCLDREYYLSILPCQRLLPDNIALSESIVCQFFLVREYCLSILPCLRVLSENIIYQFFLFRKYCLSILPCQGVNCLSILNTKYGNQNYVQQVVSDCMTPSVFDNTRSTCDMDFSRIYLILFS